MIRLGAAAAAALVACCVASAAAAAAEVTAVAMTPGRARPAESGGGHDSPATLGPLAIGANVVDRSGAEIGHVTRLTTDKTGRQVAEIRQNEDVYSIPLDDLYTHGGAAISALTLDALKHGGAAH